MFSVNRKNRLKRFGLRALLLLVSASAIAAAWASWNLDDRRRERDAVTLLEEHGGSVVYHSFFESDRTWLDRQGDYWFGEQVKNVELRKTSKLDLSFLCDMKELQCIALSHSRVSDISPLAELNNLDEVYLEGTDVRDLSPLSNLNQLEMLWLDGTPVDDLTPLFGLKKLKWLKLRNTSFTGADIEALQSELPECKIVFTRKP